MRSDTRINETIRLAADGLEAVSTGGFGRRTGGDTCEELVRRAADRARAGDEGALRFLYLRYSPAVFSYVRAMLGDEHAAEDVTQTVFARLAMRLQRYRSGEAPFGTWIARVAHNAAIDHVRAQRLVPCEEVHDPAASHEDESPGAARHASPGAQDPAGGSARGGGAAVRGRDERERGRRADRALGARGSRAPAQGPAAAAQRAHPPRRGAHGARRGIAPTRASDDGRRASRRLATPRRRRARRGRRARSRARARMRG